MGDQETAGLTLVMAVYGQPLMLAKQLATIESYPAEVANYLDLVIVDDCGTPPVTVEAIEEIDGYVKSAKLLRVEKNIPWNQMGARNLGMHVSKGWCVMIDPDMVFDGEVMRRMMLAARKLARGRFIKYGLKHVGSGRLDMSSPNTFLLHRDDFFAVGGYSEDYAGAKGWSDVTMQDVLVSSYKMEARADLFANFHSTASIPDAMVMTLDRSVTENRKKRLKHVAQAKAAGGWARWAKARKDAPRLNFPWKSIFPKA